MSTPLLPEITLPTQRLLFVAIGGPVVAAVGWSLVTIMGPWDASTTLIGLLAIGVTAVVAVSVTLAIRPWRPRSILAWGGVLIAASMGRIVLTIGICLLLYFAARQPAEPLLIGALAGLVPVLIGETTIAANRFKREAA